MASKPYETRTVSATLELRDTDSDRVRVEGYAATFNQPYEVGYFTEQIDPAAFNRTLGRSPDVRLLIDHEGQPLARTKSGTLELAPDSTGLHMRSDLDPADPDVQRIVPKMRRGDLDQMSFAFRVSPDGDSWDDGMRLRTLRNVDLHGGDVSIVTYPANENATVSLRARDLRSAHLAFADAVMNELRAGKTISNDNMARLQRVLAALAAADDNLDAAEAAVAEILGVADPDNDDQDQQAVGDMMGMNSAPDEGVETPETGRPLSLARAIADRLSV